MMSIFGPVFTVLIVMFGITILIFVHELGHFIVAKLSKIKVEAFAIGFGPKIIGYTHKDTEYRICLIPLGGYVKMAGESFADKEKKGSPDEFISKPPFTRIGVFAAGATMNLLFAIPACIIMYLLGVNFSSPQIGSISPGKSEWNSGLQVGDTILEINNQPVKTMEDYRRAVLRSPLGTELRVKALRGEETITATVTAQGSQGFGALPLANVVKYIRKGSAAEKGGLKPRDEILEISGKVIYSNKQMLQLASEKKDQPINIKIRRPSPDNINVSAVTTLTLKPERFMDSLYDIEAVENIPAVVGSVKKESPADMAGLKPGDKILSINDMPVLSWHKFKEIVNAHSNTELSVKILRKKEEFTLKLTPRADFDGSGVVDMIFASSNVLGEIPAGSPLESAGLKPDDIIIKANDKEISDLTELDEIVWESKGKLIKLQIKRGDEIIETSLAPKAKDQWLLGIEFKPKSVQQKYGFGEAIIKGLNESVDLVVLTFQLIGKLFKGEESTKGLAGPIGIFRFSYIVVQTEGISYFLWLLALFSLNLAILNLLPIPVLDGGGIFLTLIEKMKGTPVSEKVQMVAQYIGLFIILSLVFFAFYNDIVNIVLG
ncbi:MAG: RIP metalloprotease RseP [Planctomycetes bacterium]|nr:RIP metalloprotease RseP [Planctomycetota bacterium]